MAIIFFDFQWKSGDYYNMPEPRLKHVSMWKNNKWVPITIEETKRLFPNVTVSAKSGMFMCRLCNQKVALTSNTRRYFKHSRAEDDKNCEDRSEAYYNGYYGSIGSFFDYIPKEYLPLKIKVMKSNFSIEMGFGKLKIFNEVQSFSVKSEGNNVFNYSSERIQKSGITYLGVGINPAETYTLTVTGENKKSTYEIEGIRTTGVLFDSKTNRMIKYGGDVQANKEYLLLVKGGYLNYEHDIDTEKLMSINGWNLYRLNAKRYSDSVAFFFLKYGYMLTDTPVKIIPIWSNFYTSLDGIVTSSEKIYFFCNECAAVVSGISECNASRTDSGLLVLADELNQLEQVIVKREGAVVLSSLFIDRNNLATNTETTPFIEVKDKSGKVIECGDNYKIPDGNMIYIKSECDIYINVEFDGELIEKYNLRSNDSYEIDKLRYGVSIKVFAGLDLLWSCKFQHLNKQCSFEEKELMIKLTNNKSGQKIAFGHSKLSLVNYFKHMPEVKRFIYKSVRNGNINETEYKILKSYIINNRK